MKTLLLLLLSVLVKPSQSALWEFLFGDSTCQIGWTREYNFVCADECECKAGFECKYCCKVDRSNGVTCLKEKHRAGLVAVKGRDREKLECSSSFFGGVKPGEYSRDYNWKCRKECQCKKGRYCAYCCNSRCEKLGNSYSSRANELIDPGFPFHKHSVEIKCADKTYTRQYVAKCESTCECKYGFHCNYCCDKRCNRLPGSHDIFASNVPMPKSWVPLVATLSAIFTTFGIMFYVMTTFGKIETSKKYYIYLSYVHDQAYVNTRWLRMEIEVRMPPLAQQRFGQVFPNQIRAANRYGNVDTTRYLKKVRVFVPILSSQYFTLKKTLMELCVASKLGTEMVPFVAKLYDSDMYDSDDIEKYKDEAETVYFQYIEEFREKDISVENLHEALTKLNEFILINKAQDWNMETFFKRLNRAAEQNRRHSLVKKKKKH